MKSISVKSIDQIKVEGFNLVVKTDSGESVVHENALIDMAKGTFAVTSGGKPLNVTEIVSASNTALKSIENVFVEDAIANQSKSQSADSKTPDAPKEDNVEKARKDILEKELQKLEVLKKEIVEKEKQIEEKAKQLQAKEDAAKKGEFKGNPSADTDIESQLEQILDPNTLVTNQNQLNNQKAQQTNPQVEAGKKTPVPPKVEEGVKASSAGAPALPRKDSEAPPIDPITITMVLDAESDSGDKGDFITNINSGLLFNGKTSAGASVELTINGQSSTVNADQAGNWKVDFSGRLTDGKYDVLAVAKNAQGGTATTTQTLVIDTVPPETPTARLDSESDSGVSNQDAITNVNKPKFVGTAEPNSTVELTLAGRKLSVKANAQGDWEILVGNELADATYTYSVIAKDAAGNSSQPFSAELVVDTQAILTGGIDANSDTGRYRNDGYTKVTMPVFSGSSEKGAQIELSINGMRYNVQANDDGSWRIPTTQNLADGRYDYTISATDIAGNIKTISATAVIDTIAPDLTAGLASASDSGVSNTDKITNANKPVIEGSTDAEAEVIVRINSKEYTVVADSAGKWSVPVVHALPDGQHSYEVIATDLAGNQTTVSDSLVVDTVMNLTGSLDALSDSGASNSDQITNKTQLTFSGNAEPNAVVTLDINGQRYNAEVNPVGNWTLAIPSEFAQGTYNYTITGSDVAGNSKQINSRVIVDTETFVTATLSEASDSGKSVTDKLTNENKPVFEGTGEVGSTIAFAINGKTYTTSVDVSGKWSVVTTEALSDGVHSFTATATDIAGNIASVTDRLTIDMQAPAFDGGLTAASDTGLSNNDKITKINKPVFAGTGEANADVTLVIAGQTYTTTINAAGVWEVPVTNTIVDGAQNYVLTAKDAAGNATVLSGTVVIDTVALLTGRLDAAFDSGRSNSDNLTKFTQPKFTGTGEAGAAVSVTIGGNTYQDTVSATGTWAITVTNPLSEDVHSYQIRTTDIAGNEASLIGNITVDTTAPTPFTGGLDAASDSGISATDNITKINKPEFSGSVEPGATVVLTIAGASYNAEVDAQGLWKALVTATLADGVQPYTLVATDLAGNRSTLTGDITVDTLALLTGGLDVTSDTGIANNDGYTKDNSPVFSGTAEAGAMVSLQIGGSSYQTLVAENGRWRIEDVATLTDGQYSYTLTALDIAGNTVQRSGDITVDTVTTVTAGLSTVSDTGNSNTDNLTNVTRPFFDGTGEIGSQIQLTINNKTYTTQVGIDGKWSVQVSDTLPEGLLSYSVTATDIAGNTASASGNIRVDITAPSLTGGLSEASDTGVSNSDGLTKETRPLFSGTGEVGAKVNLTIAGTTYATEVDPNGNWSVSVASALTDGVKPYTIIATDAAGNSTTLTGQITVDTVAELTGRLDAAFDSGRSNSDNITKFTQPKFTGTGEAGAAVSVVVNGVTYPSVVDTNGNWSIEVTLPEGVHGYQIRTTDLAGNQASLSGNITVDTTAPTPFTGGLDSDSDTGVSNSDARTNIIKPLFSGTVELGSKVLLTISGRDYEAVVDATGRWTAEVVTGLADNAHAYTLKAIDAAGNESVLTGEIVVDTLTFVMGGLAAESDTGLSNSDGITKNTTPFFAGKGEPGASIKVNIAGQNYITTVATDGSWRVQVSNPLTPDSNYNYTITATDLAGNSAALSGNITIDTNTTLSARLDAQSDSGESNSDNITNVVRPVFSGAGEVGAKIVITINAKSYETEVGNDGKWVVTITDSLPEQVHDYTVIATDIAGNTRTETGSITVDTSAPTPFTGGLSAASDTGKFSNDGITNNNTPIFVGTAESGAKIALVINNFRYVADVQADGYWTIQIPANQPLPDGNRNYTLTATDAAGNVSTLTGNVLIDTTIVDLVGGLSSASDSGISNTDRLTKVATPFFNGTAEAGSAVVLQINSTTYTTIADLSGNWSMQVTTALDDNTYAYTLTSTDLAGNASSVTSNITIDTLAPSPFTARLDAQSDTGVLNNDKLTNDSSPSISGSGENGARVTVNIAGKSYTTQVVDGLWSIAVDNLAQGSHTFSASAEDAAGNVTQTISETFIIDTETFVNGRLSADTDSGVSSSDGLTNVTQPRFSGTTEVGNTVVVTIDGNNYQAIVDGQGNWTSVVTQALADNTYDYTITANDKAGNTASSSGTVTIDTQAPAVSGGLDVASDSVARDNITNDNTPTFSGTGEEGAVVTLKIDGQQHNATIANGVWSITVNSLSDGVKAYELFAKDAAGNQSSTITGNITVDTGTFVTGALDASSDSGAVNSDSITKFTTPLFSGTTEVGATVVLRINNVNYTAQVDNQGNWTAQVSNSLPEGQLGYSITATDIAGNTATASGNITVDTTAPDPFTGGLASSSDSGASNSDNLTNDTTPTFSGTGEVGVSITLNINNQNYTTTVGSDGTWNVTPTAALPIDGNYPYSLTATDLAGNNRSLTGSITLDTVAVLTGGLDSTSDTGRSATDLITNDTTPTFSGNAEAGTIVTLKINNKSYQTTAQSNGSWNVTVSDILSDNSYSYTLDALDRAGNQATQLSGNITVDTSTPTPFTGGLDAASNTGSTADNITKDTTPTFTGTVEAGSTVVLIINNQNYLATVTGTSWSVTAPQLVDGEYSYILRATDIAGNSVELNQSIVIDTQAPAITGSLSTISDSGFSNSDKLTKVTTPEFNGTTQPGASVVLTIGGISYNATVDAAGNWTAKVNNALPEGTQSYTITATDVAGNSASLSDSIVIDVTAPTPFTARLDGLSDTGSSNSDKVTKQTLPKITGTGENGAVVTVNVSGQNYEATVSGGVWSITVQTALSEGNHSFTAVAKDAAGNTTAPITDTFRVDISTFVTGGLDASTDSSGNGIGSNGDGLTNVKLPKFVGTAEAGASILLTIDGNNYNGVADTEGNWSIDVVNTLLEGAQPYIIKATDIAGNQATKNGSITIDSSAPAVTGGLDVSSNSGLTTDNITNDKTPTFSGTGENGSLVRLLIGGQQHTKLIENGTWSITVNELSDGLKDLRITATDSAGNTSAPITEEIVIDSVTGLTARLDAGSDSGFSNSDAITKSQTPWFSGTAEIGSSLVLTINGENYATTVNSFGNWSVRVTNPLPENTLTTPSYAYSVVSTDVAGNTATAIGTIKVDLTAPEPFTGRLDAASDSGSSDIDAITSDATPTFSGAGEPDARVTLTINNQNYSTSVAMDGTWNVTPTAALPIDGVYLYTLTSEDLAGNTRQLSSSMTLDRLAQLSGGLDGASDTGVLQNDNLTNDTRPYFSGAAEAGTIVTLSINNKSYHTTALVNGSWKVRVADALSQNDYNYTISAVDVAGNTATAITGSISVDTTAPSPFSGALAVSSNSGSTTDTITNQKTPTFVGLVEAGSTVVLLINNQSFPATVTGSNWTVTSPELVDGVYDYVLRATDKAGNSLDLNQSVTIDTTPPAISGSLSTESDSGSNNNDKLTNITTPRFNGTTEAGAQVVLNIGGTTYNTSGDASGNWSVNVTTPLAEGVQDYTITATDVAGNTASISSSIRVDTSIPSPFTARLDASSDTGFANDDKYTNDATPTISGSGENGAIVRAIVSGQIKTTVVAGGQWSVTLDDSLAQGTHTFTAEAIDAAGNQTLSISDSFIVDTITNVSGGLDMNSDSFGVGIGTNNDQLTNVKQPWFRGMTEIGNTVTLTIGNNTYNATVNDSGNWTVQVTQDLSDATQAYTINAVDKAGNTASATGSIFIDTQEPTPFTARLDETSDTGALNSDRITKDNIPTFSGTGENGARVKLVVAGTEYFTNIVDNAWSITLPELTDGIRTYSITATDAAGNTTVPIRDNFEIDTQIELTGQLESAKDSGLKGDNKTNVTNPIFIGTGNAGDQVSLSINNQTYSAIVGLNNQWTISVADALVEGTMPYSYSITALDTAGNTSSISGQLTIDTSTVVTGGLDANSDSNINTDGVTNDSNLLFSGTGEPNASIVININNTNYNTTVSANGSWSYQLPVTLLDGVYPYTITTTDDAANTDSLSKSLTVDTVISLESRLDELSDSGKLSTDGVTNDKTPTISGTGEANATVTVAINGKTYTDTVAANGTWSITIPNSDALPDNVYNYVAVIKDLAGNTLTQNKTIKIDTLAPAPFTGELKVSSDTGKLTNDGVTKITTPTYTGKGEAQADVTLVINSKTYTSVVDANGDWSIDVVDALADASYNYQLTQTDLAGNTVSRIGRTVIDTTAPAFDGGLDASSDSGQLTSDGRTNDKSPLFSGTGEAGIDVKLAIGGNNYFTNVLTNGDWNFQLPIDLTDGVYNYRLTATDAAGNESIVDKTMVVDTIASLSGGLDQTSDSGVLDDNITNVAKPLFSGTADPESSIQLVFGGITFNTTAGIDGKWSVVVKDISKPEEKFVDGDYAYTITAVDAEGNLATDDSGNQSILTGTVKIDTLTLVTARLDANSDTGKFTNDSITKNQTPVFTGNAEAGATVQLTINTKTYAVLANSAGIWTIETAPDSLPDETYTYTVVSTDIAGNTDQVTQSMKVDSTAPSTFTGRLSQSNDSGHFNNDSITKVNNPIFSGIGEEGAEVKLVIDGQTHTTTVTNGVWGISTDVMSQGVKTYTLSQTDIAGNIYTLPTANITIDTETFLTGGLNVNSDLGLYNNDAITKDNTPTFSGTAENGARVLLEIGGQSHDMIVTDGTWSFTANTLTDGQKSYTITTTDIAGNQQVSTGNITIDTQAPILFNGRLAAASDTGIADDDHITYNTAPVFTGAGENGSEVKLVIAGQSLITIVENNSWSITTAMLPTGVQAYTLTQTDIAGNEGDLITSNVTIDTSTFVTGALVATSDTGKSASDRNTKDNTPTFAGTGEEGAKVQLSIDNKNYFADVVNGLWSITTDVVADGMQTYSISATDIAGNIHTITGNITVDTLAPAPFTGRLSAISDSGTASDDNITKVITPQFNGTGEAGAEVKLEIAGQILTTQVDNDGNWAITTATLSQGNNPYTLTQTDAAGNVATPITGSIQVDTTTNVTAVLDSASDSGKSNSDRITNINTPTIKGTGENGALILLTIDNKTFQKVVANGEWEIATTALSEGNKAYTVTTTDIAGNTATVTNSVVIDTAAPIPFTGRLMAADDTGSSNSDNVTRVLAPRFTGTGENGAEIKLVIANQTFTTTVEEGAWTISTTAFTAGIQTYSITQTDAAGNSSPVISGSLNIDTQTSVTGGLASASDTGLLDNDNITYDNTPTFRGTGENGAVVTLQVADQTLWTTVTNGNWEITTDVITNGEKSYTITSVDTAGNTASLAGIIMIDTSTHITGNLTAASDTGWSDSDKITQDTTPTFTGTGEDGASIQLLIGSQHFNAVVSNGVWSITTTALTNGEKSYTITATDIAGNTASVSETMTIDTINPSNLTARLSEASDTGTLTSDRITKDNTPAFNGTGEASARVSFSIVNNANGSTKTGTAIVGSDGNWSLDLTPILGATPLIDGSYTATVNQSDAAGNTETAIIIPITIDGVTTLTGNLEAASDTGKSATDKITTDKTPTFSGTGENGATITLTIEGQTKTAIVDGGVWSITTDVIATDGTKNYTLKAVDTAGNEQTLTGSITLDTTAPTVFSGALTAATDTGISTTDGLTKVTTPVFAGVGENGAEVRLVIAGQNKTAIVAGGVWSITTDALANGVHAYTLTQTDDAGNFTSLAGGIEVDILAPTPFTGGLEAASDTGSSSADRITKVTAPTFVGTGENGAEVKLVIAGQTLSTTVNNGEWSITTAALTQGTKSYTLTQTDAAGNVTSLPASSITVDIETTVTVALKTGEDTGSSSTDTITKINTPTFSGNGEADASIVLQVGGNSYTGTVAANGTWSIKATIPLNDDSHNYTVNVTDIAGNTSTASGSVTIDTNTPSNLVGGLSAASDSGTSQSDGITKVTTPTFSGTGENGATVKLVIDGQTLTQVVSNGQWSITTAALTQGVKSYTLSQTDIAGNVFTLPAASITVDTSTTVSGGLSAVSDSGDSNSDRITHVTTPQFNGTTEVGNSVTLLIGGVTYNANVAADGSWTANVTNALTPDGVKAYTITATDIAGNSATATGNITVDTTPPTPLTANLAAASDLGTYNNDSITNVLKPTFTGTAEANASIILTINGHNYTGTANASGMWSVTVSNNLTPNMTHNYTVTAKDKAGNESSVNASITVDTLAPTPFTGGLHPDDDTGVNSTDNKTNVTAPRFIGTGENGAIVTLAIAGQNKTAVVIGGVWTITADEMTTGTKSYTLTSTDVAGNTATLPAGSITIDTSTIVTATLDQVSDTGVSQSDNITKVRTPTFVGTAEPGATVVLSIATFTYNAVVQANGNWTAIVTNNLPEGSVPYTVTATDIVGNTAQATGNIIVDTTPPSAPNGGLIMASDTGVVGDGITKLATPTLTGTAEALSTISLTIGGNTYSTAADASGNWTVMVTNSLAEGARSYSITATDKAGNVSAATTGSITVDLTPPGIDTLALKQGATVIEPWLTNLNTTGFNIGGRTENDIQVKMTISTTGQQLTTTSHASTGVFDFASFPTNLAEGTHSISIEATDKAGNTSTTVKTIQIDRSVSLTATLEAQSDTGISNTDKITNDTTPTFTGTTDPNAVVTLKLNGVSYGTATADNAGIWTITTSELSNATYSFVVSAVDTLGNDTNVLGNNISGSLVIDTIPPNVTGWLNLADDTGDQGDNVTTKQIVRFNGQSEAGATVKLYIDNKVFSAVVPSNGQYEITTTPLNYNVHSWNIIASDKAGNSNNVSGQITVQPDLIPLTVKIKDSDNTGSTSDMITRVTTPVIQGDGTPGANITVVIKNAANDTVGTFTTMPSVAGYWEVYVSPALTDGHYTLQVSSVKGVATDSVNSPLVIDTVNTLTQSIVGGKIVRATAIEVVGETDAGAMVTVEVGGATYSARANSAGSYTVAIPGLLEGAYDYTVTSVDAAGNVQTISSIIANGGGFTVDRTAPVITGRLVADSDTGSSNSDGITQDNTPTFAGTISGNYNEVYLELNYVKYYIYREANPTASPPVTAVNNVAGDGSWTLTMPQLNDGYYNYLLFAKDAANNESILTNTIRVKTKIEFSVSLEGDSGDLSTDFITNNTTIKFKGVTDPGNTVVAKLYDSNNVLLDTLTSTPNGAGAYTVDFGSRSVGTYKALFDVSDRAGNALSHTVDRVVIDSSVQNLTMMLDSTSDTGEIKYFTNSVLTDGITNVKNPVFIGTGEAKSEVTVTIKNSANITVRELTTYVGESGNWSFRSGVLEDGAYSVSAVARDSAGNISTTPATYGFTIKTTQPTLEWRIPADVNNDGIINSNEYAQSATPGRIGFIGTGDVGDKIVLTISGQEYSTSVAENGTWSITTPPLADFLYNFQLQAWDKAGNVTSVNNSVILDSGITAGIWMQISDDSHYQLDQVTKNTDPRWGILTEKDNQLTITVKRADGSVFYTEELIAPANSFIWKLPNGTTYPDGNYTVTITANDIANNTATSTSAFVIDTTIVSQVEPIISYGIGAPSYRGSIDGIYYTNIPKFTIKNTAESEITHFSVTLPDGTKFTTAEKVAGEFSVEIPTALATGTNGVGSLHNVTLTYIDRAGNTIDKVIQVSVKSGIEPFTWTLNNFNKETGIYYGRADNANFTGTTEAGLTVMVTINGVHYTALANSSGNWSIDVQNMVDGVYQMYVYVSDQWGNYRWSGDQVMVVDTFAPNFNYVADDDKDASEHILWDSQSGNLTGRAEPGSIFTIKLDTGAEEVVTVNTAGYWSKAIGNLTEGTHSLVMKAVDKAGNETVKTVNLVVDTQINLFNNGLTNATDTGKLNNDNVTNNNKPTFEGTGEAGANIAFSIAGQNYTTTVLPNGTWKVDIATAIEDGIYSYNIMTTDAAGNSTSRSGNVTIDTQTPDSLGLSLSQGQTNISGNLADEAGTEVRFTTGGQMYSDTIDENGDWAVALPPLTYGQTINVNITDIAGNTRQEDYHI